MGYDKYGKYRINIYFNPESEKDLKIINFLESKYSSTEFVKGFLYDLAMNNYIPSQTPTEPIITTDRAEVEEYEAIANVDDIEL